MTNLFLLGLLATVIIIVGCIGIFKLICYLKKDTNKPIIIAEFFFILFYGLSFILFVYTFSGSEYYEVVDDLGRHYTAFSSKHIVTLITFLSLFLVSAVAVWIRRSKLPPLVLVFCVVFLLIGIGINIAVITHLSGDSSGELSNSRRSNIFINGIYPVLNIIIAVVLIIKVVKQEAEVSANRQYKNRFLNKLNKLVARKPVVWAFILLFPVFAIITLILILFGQNPDSIVKVFTETATWKFSQHIHPPYHQYEGHYLCTVAACGHPKLVKPVRLGKRHGNEIIVNRQLMIANAYEEMISDYAPKFHQFVRCLYDKYGYPLSKHINTPFRSDIIYLLMKPIEYFFLINLYLFCVSPEKKVNKQYL